MKFDKLYESLLIKEAWLGQELFKKIAKLFKKDGDIVEELRKWIQDNIPAFILNAAIDAGTLPPVDQMNDAGKKEYKKYDYDKFRANYLDIMVDDYKQKYPDRESEFSFLVKFFKAYLKTKINEQSTLALFRRDFYDTEEMYK